MHSALSSCARRLPLSLSSLGAATSSASAAAFGWSLPGGAPASGAPSLRRCRCLSSQSAAGAQIASTESAGASEGIAGIAGGGANGGAAAGAGAGAGAASPAAPPQSRRAAYDAAAARRIAGIYYDPRVASRLTARERQVWGSLEDEPPTELMADHGLLYGTSAASLEAHLARITAAAGGGEAVTTAAAMVRRALSTRTGNVAAVSSFRKAEILKKFAGKPHDTGSSRVQVRGRRCERESHPPARLSARPPPPLPPPPLTSLRPPPPARRRRRRRQVAMLTERIQRVSAHLASNKKDAFSKRALTALTVRRRKVLEYMTRHDYQGYRVSVQELGLRPVPLVYDRHLPKQRTETHLQINERNRRLKNRVSRGHKGH